MKTFLYLVISVMLLLFARKKKEKETPTGTSPALPNGSYISLDAYLKHHGRIIPSLSSFHDTVYIKYDTLELPGLERSAFDTFFTGNPGEDIVRLNLRLIHDTLNAYIFGVANDTAINQVVWGGVPISINRTTTTTLDVPVTEW